MSSEDSTRQGKVLGPTPSPGVPATTETSAKPSFQCAQCQRQFRSQGGLLRHSNGHHPAHDRCPMQCRLCPFLTTRYQAFLLHRRMCHPTAKLMYYCCPLCSMTFRLLGRFYDHCLVHMTRQEYGLDMGGVENATEDALDTVQDVGPLDPVALPDLSLEAPSMEVSTSPMVDPPKTGNSSVGTLKSFIVEPPQSRPDYQCPYCPEKSQVPNWLQVHIYMCHGTVTQTAFKVKCGICDLIESDPAKLRVHYGDNHADQPIAYRCPTCGKFYRKLFFYEAHFKTHAIPEVLEKHGLPQGIQPKDSSQAFTCPDYSETCADLTTYEKHLQTKHTEITTDHFNAESDSDLALLRDNLYGTDTNTEALKCPLCPQTFDDAGKLLRHQESCLLNRGLPAPEPDTLDDDDDDVILVKEEIDTSWYREVVIPQSRVFSCAECDQQFDSLSLVERHAITAHRPANLALLYRCTKCERTFEGFAMFQRHSLKHV